MLLIFRIFEIETAGGRPHSVPSGTRRGRDVLSAVANRERLQEHQARFPCEDPPKDYRVRLYYFAFAVRLYSIWRLTDFLLKADIDGEVDYAPVITAGECVELVPSALIPHD